MNQDPSAVLMELLTEIGYEGNKFQFVHKFQALCHYQACWGLVGKLSESDQAYIRKSVPSNVTPNALMSLLHKWYRSEDYEKALVEASKCTFSDCFKHLIGMMSDVQQEKVKQILAKF